LVESTNPDHLLKTNEVINACLPHANKSVRIGMVFQALEKTPSLAFGKFNWIGKKSSCSGRRPEQRTISHSILGDKTEWRN
jgi:LAO/AO transport system kinase